MRGIAAVTESSFQGSGVYLHGSVCDLGHDYFLHL